MARYKSRIPKDFNGIYTEDMLSDRQKQVLDFVRNFTKLKGFPPSVREICSAVGLSSTASVHNHLRNLQSMGFINRDSAKPRALLLRAEAPWRLKQVVPVPLIGQVTAGVPILAVENVEDTYPLPAELVGTQDQVFMLAVRGDSMIKAGILDHDYVLVRRQDYANNGDIVVALVHNEEATIKRYFKDLTTIRLQPENDAYEPITGKDIKVIGKVIGLYRMM